jgi:hypothetical protein
MVLRCTQGPRYKAGSYAGIEDVSVGVGECFEYERLARLAWR